MHYTVEVIGEYSHSVSFNLIMSKEANKEFLSRKLFGFLLF